MAAPSPPTEMYTEPSSLALSISSGSSSSFLIRAIPTLDSDLESSSSLNISYNNASDSDFELQGSDTGENEFQPPQPTFDYQHNPEEEDALVFGGNKRINSSIRASAVTQDSDFEESLRSSNYSSTQEEDDEEDEANEVIPIRARLTRESDDDDLSIESGEIDNDFGFLSAVRMPVRISSITAIDFEEEDEEEEEEEEDDREFGIEPPPPPPPPPPAMEDVLEKEANVLFLSQDSEQSISTKESESEDAVRDNEHKKEQTLISDFEEEEEEDDREFGIEPPPPPAMEDVLQKEANVLFISDDSEQSISTKESESEDAVQEFHVSDNEHKKEQTLISEIADPIMDSSIEAPNIEQTLISEIADPIMDSSIEAPNTEQTLISETTASIASEDPNDSQKDDEDNDIEDERKKLVKFFRFVLRLGLSPEDSLVEELLFHHLKNPILQSAKNEAIHFEQQQQQCEDDLDSSLNILVIGKTGVGKSATINSIFGREIAKVDAFQPGTKSVTAISASINTIKLTIFDTPGFRSSSPVEHSVNTKILSSIKKAIRKSPPDIVLYVDRFDQQKQTPDQGISSLPRSISTLLGLSISNSTMMVFTHAESIPLDEEPSQAFYNDRRVIIVENNNNNQINPETWRRKLLLLGYSMKLSLLSEIETEHLPKSDMGFAFPIYRNRCLWLPKKDYTIGEEDETFMSLFVMKLKKEFEATLSKSKSGKVLFRIKSTDHQLQIALIGMLSIANAVFKRIFTDKH